jgi:hypothetical protein
MTPYGTAPPPPGKGSIGMALLSGLGAAIGGAIVWGLIAYFSKHQFSIVAVLMGLAVGSAVARFRAGDPVAAVASAVLAALGCALGTFLALVFALAGAGVSVSSILTHLNIIVQAYPHSLGGLALVFWAIAAFAAFRIPLSRTRRGRAAPRRGDQVPAPGAPPEAWPASQAGPVSFGTPPAGSFGEPPAGQPAFGEPPVGQFPAPGAGDQPASGRDD